MEHDVAIGLLGDHAQLTSEVGLMRWREWGRAPEPVDPAFWISVTQGEAGTEQLPMTWVAIGSTGHALGAVGLGLFDIEERRDRSPWLLGMVVDPNARRRGVGRRLLDTVCEWVELTDWTGVWVATGGDAVRFYEACGWRVTETLTRISAESTVVLHKAMSS